MKIAFFYEYGQIKEVGTGHKYRSNFISNELKRRGHITWMIENKPEYKEADVIVVDHVFSQKDLILNLKNSGKKIVLIDGDEEDSDLVDLSISPFYNKRATYRGTQYIALPQTLDWEKYNSSKKSNSVFVAMGGFDANNYAELAIKVLKEFNLNAIVAKSINHLDFSKTYANVIMFNEEDYYTAMKECLFGIVNGGLTLFQSIYYGLPCIALPQYEHQKNNISYVQHCCLPAEPTPEDIEQKVKWLLENEYYRRDLSNIAQNYIKDDGIKNICDLIEGLRCQNQNIQ